ncbi:hypothetical protein [Leclercia sp.]
MNHHNIGIITCVWAIAAITIIMAEFWYGTRHPDDKDDEQK